ncbi:hypothetical protein B0J18DRAFT_403084 [Chaetomium sp. MPI-SDFR-AT-0129]|nr:hypothetical protein B0J18DRAFT_403084 [Chaetomium sp. MPI-SDFR-AT-0129]
MLCKNTAAALSRNCGAVPILCSPFSPPPSPSRASSRNAGPICLQQRRSNASLHEGPRDPPDQHGALRWPASTNPTPYQILGLPRHGSYNKARYFQLAKLYHPDRHSNTSDDGIPPQTKLERYRLVVAANEILSDPHKRQMYDVHGLGWGDETDSWASNRDVNRNWRRDAGNASMNATWEDWERWRKQRSGSDQRQEEIFTSNIGFVAIISVFMIVATWGQMTRAGMRSATFLDRRDQQHASISRELRERRGQRERLDRGGRVESFLRQREAENWGYDPSHGDLSVSISTKVHE